MTQTDVIYYELDFDWLYFMMIQGQKEDAGCIIPLNGGGECHGRYIENMPWAGFWSIYIPWRTTALVGKFDENYEIGDAVDIDWTYRLYKENFKVYRAPFYVNHHHQTAHVNEDRQDLEEIKKRNGEYFKNKYGL
jgi:hypothetical protein